MRNKLKKDIHFEKYERTPNESVKETTTFNAIGSKNHQFYSISYKSNKIALTSFCKKRYWTDAIHSVHYGHFSISNWFIIIQILMIIAFLSFYCPCTFWLWNACWKLTYRWSSFRNICAQQVVLPFFGNMFWNSRGHWVCCHAFRHL